MKLADVPDLLMAGGGNYERKEDLGLGGGKNFGLGRGDSLL